MNRQHIKTKTIGILNNITGCNLEVINEATHLQDELAIDSLDVVDTLIAIENEFSIDILDVDAKNIETFGQLIDKIESSL